MHIMDKFGKGEEAMDSEGGKEEPLHIFVIMSTKVYHAVDIHWQALCSHELQILAASKNIKCTT